MRIFVSYAHEDSELVKMVALHLGAAGHRVFFDDHSLPRGGEFVATIQREIESSDLFLFFISPDAVRSGSFTLTEIAMAQTRRPQPAGYVLPVMVRPTPLEDMPAYLRAVSIFEPQGEIAAAVAHQVSLIARRRWRRRALYGAAICAVLVGMAALFWRYQPEEPSFEISSVVSAGNNFVAIRNDGVVAVLDPSFDMTKARYPEVDMATALAARGTAVAVATTAPPRVSIFNAESLEIGWMRERLSNRAPVRTLMTDSARSWLITRGALPAYYRVDEVEEKRGSDFPAPEFGGMRLLSLDDLFGVSSPAPHSIYSLRYLQKRLRCGGDHVGCISTFAQDQNGGLYYALGCGLQLVGFSFSYHNDRCQLVLARQLAAPPGYDSAQWKCAELAVNGNVVTVGLIPTSGEAITHILRHDGNGWGKPKTLRGILTSMASNGETTVAVVKRADAPSRAFVLR